MVHSEEKGQRTFVHLDVHGSPPNIILAGLLKDNSLVFGATAGFLSRKIDECTRGGNDGAFVADGIFVEKSYRGVTFDLNAIHFEPGLRKVLEILAHNWSMTWLSAKRVSEERGSIQFEKLSWS